MRSTGIWIIARGIEMILRKKNLLNFSLGRLVKQRGMKKSSQNGRYEVKIKALVFHAKIVHSKI
jgi:hypothetical protein